MNWKIKYRRQHYCQIPRHFLMFTPVLAAYFWHPEHNNIWRDQKKIVQVNWLWECVEPKYLNVWIDGPIHSSKKTHCFSAIMFYVQDSTIALSAATNSSEGELTLNASSYSTAIQTKRFTLTCWSHNQIWAVLTHYYLPWLLMDT